MSEVNRDGVATCSIISGKAQLQTGLKPGPQGPMLEVALNDGAGTFDAETGVAGGSIALDRFLVEELARSCHEFLVMLDHRENAELWKDWPHLSGNGRRAAVERLRKGRFGR